MSCPVQSRTALVGSTNAPPEIPIQARRSRSSLTERRGCAPGAEGGDVVGKAVIVKGAGGRWKIPPPRSAAGSRSRRPDGAVQPVIDEEAIPKALRTTKKDVARKPVSAQYLRSKSGSIFGVIAGADGRRLATKATTAAIVAELERRAGGETPKAVKVKIARHAPKLTTEAATKKAPLMTRLGSWQTYFPISERNYFGANIWLPAQIINGTVLKPGQRFEWWSGLGPVTTARGFGLGGYIAGDHTDPTGAMGGGMCSASTAVQRRAPRRAHDRRPRQPSLLHRSLSARPRRHGVQRPNDVVHERHEDRDPDPRRQDPRPGGAGYVRFEIWGTDDGRTVSIGKPQVRNVRQATTNTVSVSTLKPGEREQTEYPANGMDVTVTASSATSTAKSSTATRTSRRTSSGTAGSRGPLGIRSARDDFAEPELRVVPLRISNSAAGWPSRSNVWNVWT